MSVELVADRSRFQIGTHWPDRRSGFSHKTTEKHSHRSPDRRIRAAAQATPAEMLDLDFTS
jgi:hypothetical protein